jgi:hypothetical protein
VAGGHPPLAGRVGLEALENALDPPEPRVDRAPARRDELGQQRQVLEPLPPLRIDARVEALEPAYKVVDEPLDLEMCWATGRTSTRSAS